MESSEHESLDKIRTLLALERNYLAEERTALAEFRTGLTLALIGPPASAVVAYAFSPLPFIGEILYNSFVLTFLGVLTIVGIRMSLRSHSKLRIITKKKKKLRSREIEVIRDSNIAYDLLGDLINMEKTFTIRGYKSRNENP